MTPDQLSDVLVGALRDLVEAGVVALADGVPERVVVRRLGGGAPGDYASNVALQLAGRADLAPRELAGLLAGRLEGERGVAAAEVSGPGFLNVRLDPAVTESTAAHVVAAGPSYGGTADVMGSLVVPEDLVARLGPDAARYAVASADGPPTVEAESRTWTRASRESPVYRVQLVHARTCSLLRNAAVLGLRAGGHDPATGAAGRHLLRALADYPLVVATAARRREPRRVTRHLEDTATAFERAQEECPALPVGDEEPGSRHEARLLLAAATRTVLGNGLRLLGVSAPERI